MWQAVCSPYVRVGNLGFTERPFQISVFVGSRRFIGRSLQISALLRRASAAFRAAFEGCSDELEVFRTCLNGF